MKFFTLFVLFIITSVCYGGVFNSVATGNYSAASTWTLVSGTDVDNIPDADDNITILNGHTVSLNVTVSYCKNITIDAGGILRGNSRRLGVKGNFVNNGAVNTSLALYMQTTGSTITSLSPYTAPGDWYIQKSCTIAVGSIINKRNSITIQNANVQVVNFGNVTLNNSSSTATNGRIACGGTNKWINKSGSSLTLNANTGGLAPANFICTETNNTVTYAGPAPVVLYTTFYNLNITAVSTKTLTSDLHILNNFFMNGTLISTGASPVKLSVGGNVTANGAISMNNALDTMELNGTSASTQVVAGSGQGTFYTLKINNTGGAGVVFNTIQNVTGDLVMVSGNCNANGRLFLRSNAGSTADIAAITNTAAVSFSGLLTVEKFIDNMPGQYYDLSCPIQNTDVRDWDNEIFISGIGTYDGIGGPAGVDGAVFNDANTMHTYDEPSNSFIPVTGSTTPLVPGTGYNLLLADDPSATQWYAKTMTSRGIPNYGDITLSGLSYSPGSGDGWHLVGNPYASTIDYSLVSKLRMTPNIYYTDNGNYSVWPLGDIIPPYQGFYVETNTSALAHSITFTEACKVSDHTTQFYKTKADYDIKLMINSPLTPFHHQNTISFNESATVNYDENYDASYRKYPKAIAPAIYMMDKVNNRNLIKNQINSTSDEVTIPLGIFTPKAGVYYIDLSVLNSNSYKEIWIENTKTHNKYDIGASVAVEGTELGTNTDYVLRMSKKAKASSLMTNALESDLTVFTTENTLNLKSSKKDHTLKSVTVYDMTGKIVLSQSSVNVSVDNVYQIDLSALTNGIYIVSTIDENGKTHNKKVVK
ncbi:MAG: T9SS type A sorting domain-containing protein [Bacteroidota bacterium]